MTLVSWSRKATRHWVLAAILLLATALRFWRLGEAALIGDESYYWLWSEHLAPSYYDNAAGVALMVRLSTLLGGQSEAGIRWLNALLGTGAVFLIYRIGTRLLSAQTAVLGAALLAVGAPYLVISRFVYTDALQLVLLLINLLALVPFLPTTAQASIPLIPGWRFVFAALSTAALLNTKYNSYLYALGMATFLALRRPGLLRDRRTWWAAGAALIGLLPALLWNAAHDWASYRWQFLHFTQETLHRSTFLGSAWHAVRYLTFPLTLVALLGAVQGRGANRQMLLVPALVLTLPIVLSPADSPRNLLNGAALLLLLGCDAAIRWLERLQERAAIPGALNRLRSVGWALVVLLFLWTGSYGLGTVVESLGPTTWPHSPIATTLRQDGLGWRNMPPLDVEPGELIFAVDYDIAAQLRYYTGLPVQSAWGQYRIWGIPELEPPQGATGRATIMALGFVDPDLISARLQAAYSKVEGPETLLLQEDGETKELRVWTARERQVDAERFLQMFDLFDLAQASQSKAEQQARSE